MSNLVERMRQVAEFQRTVPERDILLEGAVEIERLQGLLAYATTTDAYRALRAKNEKLEAENKFMVAEFKAAGAV